MECHFWPTINKEKRNKYENYYEYAIFASKFEWGKTYDQGLHHSVKGIANNFYFAKNCHALAI